MITNKPSINLFRGKGKSFVEKFIAWALTFGRVVVILTEGIALLAFIYRFSLDRQLIDLHEEIKDKERIVKLMQKDEQEYRNLQDRISLVSTLGQQSEAFKKNFTDIMQLSLKNNSILSAQLSSTHVRLDTQFQSLSSFTQFINTLKAHPQISKISIDKIENKISSAIIVAGITATFKNGKD